MKESAKEGQLKYKHIGRKKGEEQIKKCKCKRASRNPYYESTKPSITNNWKASTKCQLRKSYVLLPMLSPFISSSLANSSSRCNVWMLLHKISFELFHKMK